MSTPGRVLVLGNSGAGKTTLAAALADRYALKHLDLDTVVWNPDVVAAERPEVDIRRDLDAFVASEAQWVIEGSYGDWCDYLSTVATLLVFLNPSVEQCLSNQEKRPWEPHKYVDPAEQERRRAFLMEWTRSYPERADRFGLTHHQRVFAAFTGWKVEETTASRALKVIARQDPPSSR